MLAVIGSLCGSPGPAQEPGERGAAAQDEPSDGLPGRRERVGGLLALQVSSEVRFLVPEGTPEPPPHRLELTFAFPDRCRWRLEPLASRTGGRRIVYRYGTALWTLPPDAAESRRLEGAEAAELLTALELRRALLLWPHGFDWRGEGARRTADLVGGHSLVAHLGPGEELPNAFESRDARGTLLEGLRQIAWREEHGRSWPARLVFEVAGQPVWREELREVDPHVRHVDGFFRPHDDRPFDAEGHAAPFLVEVPRLVTRRLPLPEATGWGGAVERFAAARAAELERVAPLGIEDAPRLELGPGGEPVALLLALTGEIRRELPPGFRVDPAGSAISMLLPGPEEIDATMLAQLFRYVPEGSTPGGPPQARLHVGRPGRFQAQVLLPLAP